MAGTDFTLRVHRYMLHQKTLFYYPRKKSKFILHDTEKHNYQKEKVKSAIVGLQDRVPKITRNMMHNGEKNQ